MVSRTLRASQKPICPDSHFSAKQLSFPIFAVQAGHKIFCTGKVLPGHKTVPVADNDCGCKIDCTKTRTTDSRQKSALRRADFGRDGCHNWGRKEDRVRFLYSAPVACLNSTARCIRPCKPGHLRVPNLQNEFTACDGQLQVCSASWRKKAYAPVPAGD